MLLLLKSQSSQGAGPRRRLSGDSARIIVQSVAATPSIPDMPPQVRDDKCKIKEALFKLVKSQFDPQKFHADWHHKLRDENGQTLARYEAVLAKLEALAGSEWSLAQPDELQEVELRRASALMGIGLYHMRPGQKPVTGGNNSEGVNFDAANKHFTDAAALLRTLRANAPARSVRLLQATRALQVCLVDHAQLFHNASTRADGRVENLPLLKQAVDLYDEGKSVPQEKRADDNRFKAVWKRRDRAKKDVLPLYYSNYLVFSLGKKRVLGPLAAQISMLVTADNEIFIKIAEHMGIKIKAPSSAAEATGEAEATRKQAKQSKAAETRESVKEEPVEAYDGSYDCLICGDSVRGMEALKCSHGQCESSSNPLHRACIKDSKWLDECPTCKRQTMEPWSGAGGRHAAAVVTIDLTTGGGKGHQCKRRAASPCKGDGAAKRARAAADLAPVPPWLWDDGKGMADEEAASLQEVMRQQHVKEEDLKFFGEEALKEAGIANAITRAKMLRRIQERFR